MNKITRIISFIAVFAMLISAVSASASENSIKFSDVDATTQMGKDIYTLVAAGIVHGNGDGTFAPASPVKRAELCKMVNGIWNFTEGDSTGFSDVTPDKWYYSHVLAGKKAGYINGFEDGTFRGEEYVTREQVCAIVCRVAGLYDLGIGINVSDAVSPWAVEYVSKMLQNRLVTLEPGNTFRAQQNMTRGELASVLAKFAVDVRVDIPETPTVNPNLNEAEMTPEEIKNANAEMLKYLYAVKTDLEKGYFTGKAKDIVAIVNECVTDAIAVGERGERLITKDFVYQNYESRITDAKKIYYSLSENVRSAFIDSVASQVKSETLAYLMDVFL